MFRSVRTCCPHFMVEISNRNVVPMLYVNVFLRYSVYIRVPDTEISFFKGKKQVIILILSCFSVQLTVSQI
jgi:hypothetical protein